MRKSLLLLSLTATAYGYDPMHDKDRPVATTESLPPNVAVQKMKLPEGFSVQVIAAEPDLVQPVAYTMDDLGRLWVLENTNYPTCPGEPKDRILIVEDTHGDGHFDKKTVFFDKMTFATGIQVGFGGVWVGAPPNLLFIPVKPGEDHPAGPPQVVLDGWGNQDTHETMNNFTWGPDGWLYGTQGVFTNSNVGRPGAPAAERVPVNAGVWRFHPITGKFERYCEGGSNQWGIDWNDHGQACFAACVIPHIWQCIQGARYTRQAGSPSDPHTYDEIKTIGDFEYEKRAYCGAMFYLGGQWPAQYRDTFFFDDIHMNKVRNEVMVREGSGFRAKRNLDFLVANDGWFRGLSPQVGPDGSVFLNDWYDKVPCYQQKEQVDRSNGRLYKIVYTGAKPLRVDLQKASSAELVAMQLNQNDWYVRHARRILQERGPDPAVHAALEKIVQENPDETRKLRALWTLHVTGGLKESVALGLLKSPQEYVRAWTIQLLCEDGSPSSAAIAQFAEMARNDTSAVVRLYLASAAGRIPVAQRWDIVSGLASHSEDAGDHNLPQLIWYAVEPAIAADPTRAADLIARAGIGKLQENIARRVAATEFEGNAAHLAMNTLLQTLAKTDAPATQLNLLHGINTAFKGKRGLTPPGSWSAAYERLKASPDAQVREQATLLAADFGGDAALAELRKTLGDSAASKESRKAALDSLIAARDPGTLPMLIGFLKGAGPLRGAALHGLTVYDDAKIPGEILAAYAGLSSDEKREALSTLAARPAWAHAIIDGLDAKTIAKSDVSTPLARQLSEMGDSRISSWLREHWGALRSSPADKQQQIARLKSVLTPGFMARGDASHGRALFTQTCALCHTLFGAGAKIGPELPGAFEDIDYLLLNIIDPNAIIGKDYQQTVIETKGGQTLVGIIAEQDASSVTLKSLAGVQSVQRSEVASLKTLDTSLMPEGLLSALKDEDVRDLFSYLRLHGQVPILASPANVSDFFNGTDLTRWIPSRADAWRVENGEIVGKANGHDGVFLTSDMIAENFHFTAKVKLDGTAPVASCIVQGRLIDGMPTRALVQLGPKGIGLIGGDGSAADPKPLGANHLDWRDWITLDITASGSKTTVKVNNEAPIELQPADGIAHRRTEFGFLISGGDAVLHVKDVHLDLAK